MKNREEAIESGCLEAGYVDGWSQIRTGYYNELLKSHNELLEACKRIISTYVFLDSLTSGVEPQHTNTIEALAYIRSVIDRAEGNEP